MSRRVVVTGMGAVTPIGNNVKDFWENVKKGTVGIGPITKFDTTDYKAHLAAEVKDFDPTIAMDKKSARRMEDFAQYAVVAAKEALEDSGLDMEKEDPFMIGCSVGCGIGSLQCVQRNYEKILTKGPNRVAPLMIPMLISNMAAGNISIQFGLKGKNINVVTACATGTHCIGEGYRSIQYGEADVMVAGGSEGAITELGVAGFTGLNALNTTDDPKRASIPFDVDRGGFVMGEGAGILVLEELEHAKARGAHIYAEVVGYGATSDAYHITLPEKTGAGAAKAMELAMEEAGIKPEQVSYINAHGTSTPANDSTETNAIKLAFGDVAKDVAISSTKSMTGHMMGATGAVEAIICAKALEEGYIPPTINYCEKDEECDLDYVPNKGRKADIKYAVSNSLGFGGHNAVLCLKKWEGK